MVFSNPFRLVFLAVVPQSRAGVLSHTENFHKQSGRGDSRHAIAFGAGGAVGGALNKRT